MELFTYRVKGGYSSLITLGWAGGVCLKHVVLKALIPNFELFQ